MKRHLSIAKKRYSFKKAYESVPLGKIESLRKDLYAILEINNRTSWSNKLKGIVSPSVEIVEGVQSVFNKYGIRDCWIITEVKQP